MRKRGVFSFGEISIMRGWGFVYFIRGTKIHRNLHEEKIFVLKIDRLMNNNYVCIYLHIGMLLRGG